MAQHIIASGKTNSSSGNYFVHYTLLRTDYKGREYETERDEYFFTKKAMLEFVDKFYRGEVYA